MRIRPLHQRVLVQRTEDEERTGSGIVIPDTAREKPQRGKVIAVGKGRTGEDGQATPPQVRPGERVLFAKYAGTEVTIEAEEYLILREDDILAVLD